MSSRLRMPTLALSLLSIGLNLAILGCAARVLDVFNREKSSSIYFLPVWNQHFDTRELSALIGTSTVIVIFNLVLVATLFVAALPANLLMLTSTILSTTMSLLALIFTSVLNAQSPEHRDTIQTWTCRWRGVADAAVPRQYDTLCHETRFAFYTTIPSFILQLILLSSALYAIFLSRSTVPRGGMKLDEEKAHELGSVRQLSFDTRLGTPKSMNDSVRYMGAAKA